MSEGWDIALTFDVDWAPEPVVDYVLGELGARGLPATFFATHDSAVLRGAEGETVEIGLHPNFNDVGGDWERPLRELHELYPGARGARSHSLFVSSHVLQLYRAQGLNYEANIFLPGHPSLAPVLRFYDLVSIPYFWSDDKHIERGLPFELDAIDLQSPGLKVLAFHPIHVFMNTHSDEHYAGYKQHYQDADRLSELRDADRPGIGTLFSALLDALSQQRERVVRMDQIADALL